MAKKASRGLSGSLGFRVLSISFLFLAVPLVLYSGVLYLVDYRQYVKNLFEEVNLILKEEVAWLDEKITYYKNTSTLIEEFIFTFQLTNSDDRHKQVTKILQKFTLNEDISAISYYKVTPDGRLICESSTLEKYVGVDFSKYKTLKEMEDDKDNVFVAEDPLFGTSLYIVKYIENEGKIEAVVLTNIAIDKLILRLSLFQKTNSINTSIASKDGMVISSTRKEFEGKVFSTDDKEGVLTVVPISYVEGGHFFRFNGKKSFVTISLIPNSEVFLIVSVPEYLIMHTFLVFLFRLGLSFLAVIVIGSLVTYLFTRRMGRPMQQLSDVMESVGFGDLTVAYEKDRYGFEINHLGESFNQMRGNLQTYIEEVKKERGLKESFEKELQIGHQIQKALLPSKEIQIKGVEIASYYSAAKEVAGDFYDYIEIHDDNVLITIADGVGKGISSCLYSFDLRSILKTAALDGGGLNDLIVKTNNIFCSDTKESCNFVTLVSGFLNRGKKSFTFTNAGHLPVLVKKLGGEVESFTTKGIALGIDLLEKVDLATISLKATDYCVLYTDGVTEAQNNKDELYTEKRLIESMERFDGDSSIKFAQHIMKDVETFVGESEQYDDITLLVFRLQ